MLTALAKFLVNGENKSSKKPSKKNSTENRAQNAIVFLNGGSHLFWRKNPK